MTQDIGALKCKTAIHKDPDDHDDVTDSKMLYVATKILSAGR